MCIWLKINKHQNYHRKHWLFWVSTGYQIRILILSGSPHRLLSLRYMGGLFCCNRRQEETRTVDAGQGSLTGGALSDPTLPLVQAVNAGRSLLRFKVAVRRVIHLLALRRRWAAYGRILQSQPRRHLWDGLTRKKGVLHRTVGLCSE